ncbi:MAG: hypothetical protein ACR2PR_07765 [Pseudohongiellaceae bacterium]
MTTRFFHVQLNSDTELQQMFLSELKQGGLLLPGVTDLSYQEQVFIQLELPHHDLVAPLLMRAVWISRKPLTATVPPGCGMEFAQADHKLVRRIGKLASAAKQSP